MLLFIRHVMQRLCTVGGKKIVATLSSVLSVRAFEVYVCYVSQYITLLTGQNKFAA